MRPSIKNGERLGGAARQVIEVLARPLLEMMRAQILAELLGEQLGLRLAGVEFNPDRGFATATYDAIAAGGRPLAVRIEL